MDIYEKNQHYIEGLLLKLKYYNLQQRLKTLSKKCMEMPYAENILQTNGIGENIKIKKGEKI